MQGRHRALACTLAVVSVLHAATARSMPIVFDTTLESLNLTASNVLLPLGSGYQFVRSDVSVRLSSSRNPAGPASIGQTTATPLSGSQYEVVSFFDVVFDLTLTDVDPSLNYALGPDGTSLAFRDLGPMRIESRYAATLDQTVPALGLFPPPQSAPYAMISSPLVIPLGADVDGNGQNDVFKISLFTLTFRDAGRTFIQLPDGTVIFNINAGATIDGAVQDASNDPPFSFGLTGPTTATAHLAAPAIPEPASLTLCAAAGLCLVAGAVLRRRSGR